MSNDKHRHDLKHQLGIILGFSEILLAGVATDDPRYGDLDEIRKAALAALELVEHVFPAPTDASGGDRGAGSRNRPSLRPLRRQVSRFP